MPFVIGRRFAEDQILKKNLTGPKLWTVCYILMKFLLSLVVIRYIPRPDRDSLYGRGVVT